VECTRIGEGLVYSIVAEKTLVDGAWFHLSVQLTNLQLTVFLNGERLGSTSWSPASDYATEVVSVGRMSIGGRLGSSGYQPVVGAFDDFMVARINFGAGDFSELPRPLTVDWDPTAEPDSETGIHHWFHFDEGSGTSTADSASDADGEVRSDSTFEASSKPLTYDDIVPTESPSKGK